MKSWVIPAVLAAAGLAGCGQQSSGEPEVLPTPQAIAADIGCSGFTLRSTQGLDYWQMGTCQLDGSPLQVFTFKDPKGQRDFVEEKRPAGGTTYVTGKWWVVEAPSREVAGTVATRTGGQTV